MVIRAFSLFETDCHAAGHLGIAFFFFFNTSISPEFPLYTLKALFEPISHKIGAEFTME